MEKVLFALWFFLPGGIANGSAVFGAKIPLLRNLNWPMDFGKYIGKKRVFGPNKTVRGLLMGIIVATIIIAGQKIAYIHIGWIREISQPVNYNLAKIWLIGPLMGGGALVGDAVESFFKRRANIEAGKSWFPFDQIDYVVGGCLLSYIVVKLSFLDYLLIVIVWVLLHMITTYLGYLTGIRKRPI